MIKASSYGKDILNALFNTGKKTSSNTVTFPLNPYIGLLTQMPNGDGSGFVEVDSDDYARVLLTGNGLYGKQMIATAATETDRDGVVWAYVENTNDVIAFPYSETDVYGDIVGFGIFESDSKNSTAPIAWGKLGNYDDEGNFVEQPVTVAAKEVPIFLKKKFKFRMA